MLMVLMNRWLDLVEFGLASGDGMVLRRDGGDYWITEVMRSGGYERNVGRRLLCNARGLLRLGVELRRWMQ